MEQEYMIKKVAIRLVEEPPLYSSKPICRPEDAVSLLGEEIRLFDREVVGIINLLADGKPINCNIASIGSISASIAVPREIFKTAILSNAASIILMHNHPSGSVYPSVTDVKLTEQMARAGELLGIEVQDHIIIGSAGRMFSFRSEGIVLTEKRAIQKSDIMPQIGENLRKLRMDANVTMNEVAQESGIHPATISRLESGQSTPDLKTLIKLSRYYGVKMDDMVTQNHRLQSQRPRDKKIAKSKNRNGKSR